MHINRQPMTFSWRRWAQVLLVPLLVGGLVACGSRAPAGPQIEVEGVWSRPATAMAMGEMSASSGGSETGMEQTTTTSAVYMRLVNTGRQADRLLGARTDVAQVVEIHESHMEGEVMTMQPLPDGLEIPAGREVALKPGGYHLMLIGLQGDLQVGDRFPLVLTFEKSGTLTVEAEVREP